MTACEALLVLWAPRERRGCRAGRETRVRRDPRAIWVHRVRLVPRGHEASTELPARLARPVCKVLKAFQATPAALAHRVRPAHLARLA